MALGLGAISELPVSAIPVVTGTTLTVTGAVPTEFLASPLASAACLSEWSAAVHFAGVATAEFLASVGANGKGPSEFLSTVSGHSVVLDEFSATIRYTQAVLDEWEGALLVTADEMVPVEFSSAVSFTAKALTETTGVFRSVSVVPDEALRSFSWSGTATAEWLALQIIGSGIPCEFLGIISTVVTFDSFVTVEWAAAPSVPPQLVGTVGFGPDLVTGPQTPPGEVYIAPRKGRGKGSGKSRSDYPKWPGWGRY